FPKCATGHKRDLYGDRGFARWIQRRSDAGCEWTPDWRNIWFQPEHDHRFRHVNSDGEHDKFDGEWNLPADHHRYEWNHFAHCLGVLRSAATGGDADIQPGRRDVEHDAECDAQRYDQRRQHLLHHERQYTDD